MKSRLLQADMSNCPPTPAPPLVAATDCPGWSPPNDWPNCEANAKPASNPIAPAAPPPPPPSLSLLSNSARMSSVNTRLMSPKFSATSLNDSKLAGTVPCRNVPSSEPGASKPVASAPAAPEPAAVEPAADAAVVVAPAVTPAAPAVAPAVAPAAPLAPAPPTAPPPIAIPPTAETCIALPSFAGTPCFVAVP